MPLRLTGTPCIQPHGHPMCDLANPAYAPRIEATRRSGRRRTPLEFRARADDGKRRASGGGWAGPGAGRTVGCHRKNFDTHREGNLATTRRRRSRVGAREAARVSAREIGESGMSASVRGWRLKNPVQGRRSKRSVWAPVTFHQENTPPLREERAGRGPGGGAGGRALRGRRMWVVRRKDRRPLRGGR